MNANIKISGIDQAIPIHNLKEVRSTKGSITDFTNLFIKSSDYYIFIGDETLSTSGQQIEFVYLHH